MADLTTQTINYTGPTATGGAITFASAATGGDEITWGKNVFAWVKNGGATSCTVTVTSVFASTAGATQADQTKAIAAAGETLMGPFPRSAFGRATGGAHKVALGYSATASVTVAAVNFDSASS